MPFDSFQKLKDHQLPTGRPYEGDRAPTGYFAVIEGRGHWLEVFAEEGMGGTHVRVLKEFGK